MVPVVLVLTLIGALLLGLNMLKRMSAQAPRAGGEPLVGLSAPPPAARTVEPDIGVPGALPPREVLLPESAPQVQAQLQAQDQMARAEQLMRASDWAGLVSLSRQWSQAQPTRQEPWQFQGVAFSRLGDFNAAAEAFKQVLLRDPANAGARVLLAEAYLQGGRHAEAAEQYKTIVAANPGDARLWSNYGLALSALDQDAQAIAALETAVKLDPSSKPAWNNLGIAYQNAGDGARAAAAFANAR
jgi:tetratricopeptide (TPR) repeat protein